MEHTMSTTSAPMTSRTPFAIGRVIAERMRQFAGGFAGTSVDIDVEAAARAADAWAHAEAERNAVYAQYSYAR